MIHNSDSHDSNASVIHNFIHMTETIELNNQQNKFIFVFYSLQVFFLQPWVLKIDNKNNKNNDDDED